MNRRTLLGAALAGAVPLNSSRRTKLVVDRYDNAYAVLPFGRIAGASKASDHTDRTLHAVVHVPGEVERDDPLGTPCRRLRAARMTGTARRRRDGNVKAVPPYPAHLEVPA
ncbi:hypothetical protein SAMN02745830_00610 [Streptomyces sp. Amel2xC10]|nr:hypothetical protein SAMN02745830_00610 [Streptomyces sp. Amel2xC10]